jgi:hypothetical protein
MNISIANDFNPYPHGRTKEDGPFSGAKFRDEHLVPAVQKAIEQHAQVVIDLDGLKTLGSSFSEEAFGGLIRLGMAPARNVMDAIKLTYTKPWLRPFAQNIQVYMSEAAQR